VQTSYASSGAAIAVLLLTGVAMWVVGGSTAVLWIVLVAILLPVMIIFSRLSVRIDADTVEAAFGWGIPKRVVELSDIVDVHQVRNRWYHGWGIHAVSGGRLYNVGGFDAVELKLRSGKVFRIGTDEPAQLVDALSKRGT
jgi:hypothetical protein